MVTVVVGVVAGVAVAAAAAVDKAMRPEVAEASVGKKTHEIKLKSEPFRNHLAETLYSLVGSCPKLVLFWPKV